MEKKASGMLDKHGDEIMEGDILRGSFYGQGGWWYQFAIVHHSTDKGFYLELEGHDTSDFNHPKFRLADRREIKQELPRQWNAMDKENHTDHRYCGVG